jgi:hypothetical protein
MSRQGFEKERENKAGQGRQGTKTTTGENTGETRTALRKDVPVHEPEICPVHPVQASIGAGLPGQGAATSPRPPCPWTDLDRWCAHLGAAGDLHARREVLRDWVDAAGGWHDAVAIHLPVALPAVLALATLKAHARALRLDVREDLDEVGSTAWLRGAAP